MADQKVTTKLIDYNSLVRKALGDELNKPEVAYQFSNGREFHSTDKEETGIYRRD